MRYAPDPVSMLYPSMEPNERFRARRAEARRKQRRRRAGLVGIVLAAVLTLAGGMTLAGKSMRSAKKPRTAGASVPLVIPATTTRPRPLPLEIRGVHVTGALASLPGKLREYVGFKKHGLNTIELDIKDEGGIVNFVPSAVPLAQQIGASRPYVKLREVAALLHRNGVYLICRLVVFQDPVLARARPDLAIRTTSGGIWTTYDGLGWVNPYDQRVWDYSVSVAEAAARTGCDEIMFDYVRFPSDGDIGRAVYAGKTSQARGRVVADFVGYAHTRLAPLGVRVSTAVFGLSATRDLRIGQVPKWISAYVENLSPMAYPALYGGGELGIQAPSAEPGETVFRTLVDFRRATRGRQVQLVPWIQDWNYTLDEVKQQIDAVRLHGAKGFLLWNAAGRYTKEALAPPP
jgi:hypothetical protein